MPTTQPTFPGIDPSWYSQPGVKGVISGAILLIVILVVWTYGVSPMIDKAMAALGKNKKTWKDELSAKVQANAQAAQFLLEQNAKNPATDENPPELEKTVNQIATGTIPPTT